MCFTNNEISHICSTLIVKTASSSNIVSFVTYIVYIQTEHFAFF